MGILSMEIGALGSHDLAGRGGIQRSLATRNMLLVETSPTTHRTLPIGIEVFGIF
jgi:hypothetical protein